MTGQADAGTAVAPRLEPDGRDIAIVGIGARLPDASDLAQFRSNLLAGKDSVGGLPAARAAATGLDPEAGYLPMGYLADIHTFDYAFFGLSRREASLIDPQHRLALVLAYQAIEDAGYATGTLRDAATAVVFSAPTSNYQWITGESGALSALGNVPFGLPARIAHVLGLAGPCYAVDTGCNGSLVSVHHARRELAAGDADYAVAGGVSLRVGGIVAAESEGFTELVSQHGHCRAFDAAADGAIVGEGGAALLLTTVERARADRAPIYAVLRGSATLHNGHSSATISAPSSAAQEKVIGKAWRDAGLTPERAGYLEAHGSGTRLGDAVELEAIAAAFAGRSEPLPIGSVKTNIGHLDHAAGIAGLVKAVLSVRFGELYPSLHFERPTGDRDLGADGIEVVTAGRSWPQHEHRLCAVSSFSLGGINAHCVVQQAPEQAAPSAPAPRGMARLVPVSAHSRVALVELCRELALALRGSDFALDDVAFTLARGRTHHEHRVAVLARDTEELATHLAAQAVWLDAEDPGQADEHGRRRPAVALVLSPDSAPAGTPLSTLPARLPATGRAAEILAGQLAACHELRAGGVEFAAILSSGISRYAARYLLGTLSDVDSQQLAAGVEEAVSADADRLIEAARKLFADQPVVFVEPGPGGCLGTLLSESLGADEPAEVRAISAQPGGILGVFGLLYQHGLELDWGAIGPGEDGARRLRLPGHPMRGSRCWADAATPLPTSQDPASPVPARAVGNGAAAAVPATPAAPDTPPAPPVASPDEGEVVGDVAREAVGDGDSVDWLRATLAELLHTETEISPDADYFELGGNSIIALQLVDRVQQRYGLRPKLIDVYERPTVQRFAELIGSQQTTAPAGYPPVTRRDDKAVLSFGQERMWFHHQIDEDTTLYNLPMFGHITGPIDIEAWRGTWEGLAERHEVLRTNIIEVDGEPALRIRPDLGDFFRFTDVSGEPDPRAAARALVREAATVRFDLANEPLLRVLVVRLAPEEHVVQITAHHAVLDGGAAKILKRELPELYAARLAGRPHELAPLPVRFRDYAAWQRELMAGAALDHELEYWKQRLHNAPRLRMPTDHPRPARKNFAGDVHPFNIPAPLVHELRRLAQRESVTMFVVLLAGLYLVMSRYSEQEDLLVGTPTTGRNRPELQDLIGFFNSTVVLRADLSGAPDLAQFLGQVRSVVLDALEHQEVPFDRVVGALGAERELSRAPVFDVFYVHQELPPLPDDGEVKVGDVNVGFSDDETPAPNTYTIGGMPAGTAKFDLTLITADREGDEDIPGWLEFSTELFTQRTAAELAAAYLGILHDMVVGGADRSITTLVTGAATPAGQARSIPEPESPVPTDRARTGADTYSSAIVSEPVPAELHASLAAVAGGPDGLDDVLLAGWTVLLAWYSGQDEVPLSATGTAVRPELSGEPGFTELIGTLRRARAAGGPARGGAVRYGGRRERPDRPAGSTTAELNLCWSATDDTAGLRLELVYATELFDRDTVETMAADLRRVLSGLVANPDEPVQEVAMNHIDRHEPDATMEAV